MTIPLPGPLSAGSLDREAVRGAELGTERAGLRGAGLALVQPLFLWLHGNEDFLSGG